LALAFTESNGIVPTERLRLSKHGDFLNIEKGVIMAHPVILESECIGCGICVDACPQEVLEVSSGVAEAVNEEACIGCGECVEECPMGAIPEIAED
jgi:NAD-dependent dihydropyrimidine dehydrogenase PreA subunit